MSSSSPTVVIAPDSFKGSCTAPEAAAALAAGVRAALGPDARAIEVPLADGGEGSLDALVSAWHGEVRPVPTTDALGRPRSGRIGVSGDGRTAIIEAAEANGLPHVLDAPLRALDADSFGVGTLVRAALDEGARDLVLCLGGSATSDGGAGMLRALGARLLDREGSPITPGARGLRDLKSIDLTGLHPAAGAARWRIACDVENPLTGPRGAAAVFGPQKGATAADVAEIDAGLAQFARVLAEGSTESSGIAAAVSPTNISELPGMGAAGGLALAPVTLFGGELVPGAELVADAAGLREALHDARLVITGEGRLDAQSLDGKVVSHVVAAAPAGVPVVVVAGSLALSAKECRRAGITAAFSLAAGPASLEDLQRDAVALLEQAGYQVAALAFAGA
ncbi:MAG: glycerate kinase [Leucobacter sp.]